MLEIENMLETALTKKHIELGAKMAEFAGYNMPIVYAGIKEEHQCVREKVGVFDVSHMGEFIVKGEGALDLIQKVVSNDASKLEKGQAQYAYLPNDKGGIVDDLLVYHLDDDNYMLVVNASNMQKDWDWILKHNTENVEIHNISSKTTLLAVQGPEAVNALQSLTSIDLASISYYRFVRGDFAGKENVIISATGYTGSGGFELYFKNEYANEIWDQIFKVGEDFGIQPIGLGARDTLRLEMGYCLYGNDINDTTSPFEAGLGWVTKLKKEGPFEYRSLLQDIKDKGINRKLVGFELLDRGVPRHDYPILNVEGNEIGIVTSGTHGPSVDKAIGMGYVSKDFANPGSEIFIGVRKKRLRAKVVKLPFYK